MHLGLELTGPLCPMSNHGSPVILLKLQMSPKLILFMFSGTKKKEPRYGLCEVKAPHSQRMWPKVFVNTTPYRHGD